MFSYRNLLILSFSVILLLPISTFAEEGDRDSGIRHLKCVDLQKSILNVEKQQTAEFEYIALLSITQNDGKCIMKNKLGKTYLTPWMPVYHIVYLKDMDFGVIDKQRIIIPDEITMIPFELYNDIPYCVEVVSVWLDNRVRTETSSEICF